MYLTCGNGHSHWGRLGAAGAVVVAGRGSDPRVLLTFRSAEVHHPHVWSTPGGAIDPDDADPYAAARREISEELAVDVGSLTRIGAHEFNCGGWRYTTVLLESARPFEVDTTGWETERADWLELDTIDELSRTGRLHPGFAS